MITLILLSVERPRANVFLWAAESRGWNQYNFERGLRDSTYTLWLLVRGSNTEKQQTSKQPRPMEAQIDAVVSAYFLSKYRGFEY